MSFRQAKREEREGSDLIELSESSALGFLDRCFPSLARRATFSEVLGAVLLAITFFIISLVAIAISSSDNDEDDASMSSSSSLSNGEFGTIDRIAFGSCTSYKLQDQPIWEDAIIPSNPDMWIWGGDITYLDNPVVNCDMYPSDETCNCTSDWLHKAPHGCMAGDIDNAQARMMSQLRDAGYQAFLDFMCPNAVEEGYLPPPGQDASICTRPILGTWDDHDYGWNNGNKRLPNKDTFKKLFLDAIGEPADSTRRNMNKGLYWKYDLHDDVDLFMLDGRYDRDTIPCHKRRDYCEKIVLPNKQHVDYAFCDDFLYGNFDGQGSCCAKDEQLISWCAQPNSVDSEYYEELCDVSSDLFGHRMLVYRNGSYHLPDYDLDGYDYSQDSPFCEMLGRNQRKWLRYHLDASRAKKLSLIVSGSVLLGNPSNETLCNLYDPEFANVTCPCSSDDWECYNVAQQEILSIVNQSETCAVYVVGDYHIADLKYLNMDEPSLSYHDYYKSSSFQKNQYQIMSSGLTYVTAKNESCLDHYWTKDVDNLRISDHPECDYVTGVNFGLLDFEYQNEAKTKLSQVSLKIMSGKEENVLKREVTIDVNTCTIV